MGERLQCLLVDDDLDDQEIFLMTLEQIDKNITCFTANNGVEALTMLRDNKVLIPDYIFLDVNMPKMNGVECLKNINGFQHLKDTKIFMYSTTSETSVMEETKRLGALDFIVKPASSVALNKILSKIFG